MLVVIAEKRPCLLKVHGQKPFGGVPSWSGGVRTDCVLFKTCLEEEMPDELGGAKFRQQLRSKVLEGSLGHCCLNSKYSLNILEPEARL